MPACGLCSNGSTRSPTSTASLPASPTLPYARSQHPDYGDRPTAAQIRADLKTAQPLYPARSAPIRSTGGVELVPAIAAEFGLKVTLGIWIDKNEARNEREIQSAHRARPPLQQRQRDRGRQRDDAARARRRSTSSSRSSSASSARARCRSPPAKSGRVWIDHPGARLGGRLHRRAHPALLGRRRRRRRRSIRPSLTYDKLRRAHPGKRIVIAEFGWPSAGYNMHDADPGRIEQAPCCAISSRAPRPTASTTTSSKRSTSRGRPIEGGVGPYWGVFDASRQRQVRLDRAGQRSRPLEARRPRASCSACCCRCRSWRIARATRRRGRHACGRAPMRSAPGSRSSSRSGTATISCRARPSRSGSASCC